MDQGLYLTPERNIKLPQDVPYRDLAERAKAACATIRLLETEGLPTMEGCEEDDIMASLLAEAYALDSDETSKQVSDSRMADLSPDTIRQVNFILQSFGMMVAKKSEEIRNVVINKLLILSDDADKRVQLRALEDLGKIGEVGLFTDRKDVHVTHHAPEETQELLREKLLELKKQDDGTYA